jgi:hypothetical protein
MRSQMQNQSSGQISVEMVILASVMVGLLLVIFLVNDHLNTSWEQLKQNMEASSAAGQVALAINRAASSGNGTQVAFLNRVGPDVTRVEIFNQRSVRAHYLAGGFASAALVTNNTNFSGDIPVNQLVVVRNIGGTISQG